MKKYYKKIYNVPHIKKHNIKHIVKNRYNVLMFAVFFIFFILTIGLINVQIVKSDYYENNLKNLTKNIIYSTSTPRGRIYDRNGKIIVDNEAVKAIYYKKDVSVSRADEINMAYQVASMIDLDYSNLTEAKLKQFYVYKNFEDTKNLITDEEWILYEERKLSNDDINNLKLERIDISILESLTSVDRLAAYIYTLMNTGYSYDDKVIKKYNVTEEEYAKIAENANILTGFYVRLDWERVYPYGDVFRNVLGDISTTETGLPYELKDHYLNLGYSLNDRVGISYLEYQYESILKGTKTAYEILDDGSKKIIDEGSRGNDIVLTIDIELQQQIEQILVEEIINAKEDANSNYYDKSFVIISDPNNGEILAMASKQVVEENGEYKVYDYTIGVINHAVTVGSAVKGASHIAGYNNGALQIGEVRSDTCIKIAATPEKCSFTNLGYTSDITALKYSSNVFQYKTAINLGKGIYSYNQPLSIDTNAFNLYRDTFSQFGLGVLTGIDLPNEAIGYQGNSTLSGHLLDFSIGQYDNYTPIQVSQYINTIANGGYRVEPKLLKAVYKPTSEALTEILYETKTNVLNKLETDEVYLNRVKEGFREVMTTSGSGVAFINSKYQAAGKTGTAESFKDITDDGTIDIATMSNSFVAYAPYDNPEVSFTVISPDVYYNEGRGSYRTPVNRKISYRISEKYFELYK